VNPRTASRQPVKPGRVDDGAELFKPATGVKRMVRDTRGQDEDTRKGNGNEDKKSRKE
jgi:hypothetical protein